MDDRSWPWTPDNDATQNQKRKPTTHTVVRIWEWEEKEKLAKSHVNISLPKIQRCTKEEWEEMKKKLPKKTILERIKERID